MRIDTNHSVPSLRLVRPPQAAPPVTPAQLVARSADQADTFSFESLYVTKLPQPGLSEAHRRLEHIRKTLVAARTDVPIHFQQSTPPASANPYAIRYQQSVASPAAMNETATDHAAGES